MIIVVVKAVLLLTEPLKAFASTCICAMYDIIEKQFQQQLKQFDVKGYFIERDSYVLYYMNKNLKTLQIRLNNDYGLYIVISVIVILDLKGFKRRRIISEDSNISK